MLKIELLHLQRQSGASSDCGRVGEDFEKHNIPSPQAHGADQKDDKLCHALICHCGCYLRCSLPLLSTCSLFRSLSGYYSCHRRRKGKKKKKKKKKRHLRLLSRRSGMAERATAPPAAAVGWTR
ncbi:uncharacterized protein LOC144031977 [Festucalex cinctus]